MSRRQNNFQYGKFPHTMILTYTVQEEPDFLRRMREGFAADDTKAEEKRRRRRGSQEIIDEDEAPQVVIQEKDKDMIDAEEARAYVAEKAGVTVSASGKVEGTKVPMPAKPREENVSLGMKKRKKNEGLKRTVKEGGDGEKGEKKVEGKGEQGKGETGKVKKAVPRKEKRLKLSFEEDE